jgi:excisionase family DNA binding protein
MSDYVTVREAADRLRISERTLRKYLKGGEVPHYRPTGKPKGKILLRWTDVEAWLEHHRVRLQQDEDVKAVLVSLFGRRRTA